MSKENKSRFIPYEIFGDTPATRRWFVVSVCEAAKRELTSRDNPDPSEEDIRAFVSRAKKLPLLWVKIQNDASVIRRKEFGRVVGEIKKGTLPTKEELLEAGKRIEEIYSEIDGDPELKAAFLDEIVLSK